jgi:hypothetical protein
MRTFTLIAVLFVATCVRAELIVSYSLSSYDSSAGKRFDFEVTREQLLRAPPWAADQDSPPLSPRRAERLAATKLHELVSNRNAWERKQIILENMGDGVHWIYIVEYSRVGEILGGLSLPFRVVILMDGTVIEPKVLRTEPNVLPPH